MTSGIYKFVTAERVAEWLALGWVERGNSGWAKLIEWDGEGEPVMPARGQSGADQNNKT